MRIENQTLKNKNIERSEEVSYHDLHNRQLKEDLVVLKRELEEFSKIRDEHKYLSDYKSKANTVIEKNSELAVTLKREFFKYGEQLTTKIEQSQRKLK